MEHRSNILKVLSPVENKHGKTFWIRIGSAFINRDGSTNVYLNAYPTSGKLQIRELDDRDRHSGNKNGSHPHHSAGGSTRMDDHRPPRDESQDDLPF